MEYSYKFRLYPTPKQECLILQTFGACRFVWNHYLAARKEAYEREGRTLNYYDCAKDVTRLKETFPWLREVDSTALQSSLRDLDRAYQNFFQHLKQGQAPGYPRFKAKHDRRQSYCTRSNIRLADGALQLPKLGSVKCRISKEVKGRILSVTVSRNPAGRYFAALCCTGVEPAPMEQTGAVVGVDLGIRDLAVTSDGAVYPNGRFLAKEQKKLARLQRQLSRKQKGSHNREKARLRLARAYEHIANQRQDALQKLTTELVRQYDVLCIEDISVKETAKTPWMAKLTPDAGWNELRRQLEYKAEWYGKRIVTIDRYYPSTRLCSACGQRNQLLRGKYRERWTCPHCGVVQDSRLNAAKNILQEGLRRLA